MRGEKERVAVITCDTDWAEEETIREAHELLCSLGKPITYFVTQRYAFQDEPAAVPLEFGPHPRRGSAAASAGYAALDGRSG